MLTGNLPPRFLRKQQQMQQKEITFTTVEGGQTASQSSANNCPSPPGHAMNFQSSQTGSTYSPMMPPNMLGHSTTSSGSPIGTAGFKQSPGLADDINLRPMRNYTPLLRPNTPATLPKSAQSAHPPTNHRIQVNCVIFFRYSEGYRLKVCCNLVYVWLGFLLIVQFF